MNFIKTVLEVLSKVNLQYNKDVEGKQKLILDIKNDNNVGGGLSVDFGNNKSTVIDAKFGSVPDNKNEEVE